MPFENTEISKFYSPPSVFDRSVMTISILLVKKNNTFLFKVFKDRTTSSRTPAYLNSVYKAGLHSENIQETVMLTQFKSGPAFAISEADLFPPGASRAAQENWKIACTGLASFNLQHPSNIADKERKVARHSALGVSLSWMVREFSPVFF